MCESELDTGMGTENSQASKALKSEGHDSAGRGGVEWGNSSAAKRSWIAVVHTLRVE